MLTVLKIKEKPAITKPGELKRELWSIIGASFLVALGYGVVAPTIPQIAKSFGVSVTLASSLISAFAMMRMLGAPVAGWFADRFTERRGYMFGLTILAISTGACAFAPNYETMVAMRAAGGIGSVIFSVSAASLLIKIAPENSRGKIVSYNGAAFLLGNLFGPVLGALVTGFGLRAPFVFYAIMLLFSVLFIKFAIPKESYNLKAASGSSAKPRVTVKKAFHKPAFRAAIYSLFTTGWAIWGVRISVIPIFVATVFNSNPAAAGWALAAFAAGNAAFIIPSGRLNDRFGRKPLIFAGLSTGTASYALLPFSDTVAQVCALMVVCGVGASLANPAQQAVIADIAGKKSGTGVVSASQMAIDMGSMIAPIIIGLSIDNFGYTTGFLITAGVLLTGAGVWLFAPETLPKNIKKKRQSIDTGQINMTELIEPNPVTGAVPVLRAESAKKDRRKN